MAVLTAKHFADGMVNIWKTLRFVTLAILGENIYGDLGVLDSEPVAGYSLWVTFMLIGSVVQMNLLIAMMTCTYDSTFESATGLS